MRFISFLCLMLLSHLAAAENLLANPIRVLVESGFFFYSDDTKVFSISPEIWICMDKGKKSAITKACNLRLKEYYGE